MKQQLLPADVEALRNDARYWETRADNEALPSKRMWLQSKANVLRRAAGVYEWVLDMQNEVEREQSAGS